MARAVRIFMCPAVAKRRASLNWGMYADLTSVPYPVPDTSKHETSGRWCFNVESASQTVGQNGIKIGSTYHNYEKTRYVAIGI